VSPLAEALQDARNGGEAFTLTCSQRDDLWAIVALWNAERKRAGKNFNMTPREALSRLLAGFREDLEALAKEQ
jgi:hypothetical protein